MAENTEVAVAAAAPVETKKVSKKGASASGAKKPKAKPTHPPTSQMVDAAIKTLKERGGSSLLAIKKYLAANYKVDADKLAPFIKKHLKSSVESGKYIQTKGKGASGSFKLSPSAAKPKKESKPKPKVKKPKSAEKKVKKVSGEKKKKAATKKVSAEKKKSEKSTAKAAKKSGSVKSKAPKQKSTKPSKTDAKKPKAPKPKKAAATGAKKAAAKKPAAKK